MPEKYMDRLKEEQACLLDRRDCLVVHTLSLVLVKVYSWDRRDYRADHILNQVLEMACYLDTLDFLAVHSEYQELVLRLEVLVLG